MVTAFVVDGRLFRAVKGFLHRELTAAEVQDELYYKVQVPTWQYIVVCVSEPNQDVYAAPTEEINTANRVYERWLILLKEGESQAIFERML